MQWTERQPKKGSNTWNTNSVIFVQYFTFSAVKQLNKYPRPRYILLGTPQPNYSGSELGNQSFVYFTFCYISVELLRRRRINCVYIGGRMFLTARWKSTQCQSFTANSKYKSNKFRGSLIDRVGYSQWFVTKYYNKTWEP